jgi:hypothetical protein
MEVHRNILKSEIQIAYLLVMNNEEPFCSISLPFRCLSRPIFSIWIDIPLKMRTAVIFMQIITSYFLYFPHLVYIYRHITPELQICIASRYYNRSYVSFFTKQMLFEIMELTITTIQVLSRISVIKTRVWIGESVYWNFTSRNYN